MKDEILSIKQRNKRVEADKAWEVSATRRVLITFMTYIVVVVFLYIIGSPHPWLSALVPAIGFALSTLTLPFFKEWWLKNVYKK